MKKTIFDTIFVGHPEYDFFKALTSTEKVQYLFEIFDIELKRNGQGSLINGLSEFFDDISEDLNHGIEFDSYDVGNDKTRVDVMIDSESIVLVPNQRAGVLLLKDMNKILNRAFIAPEILTLSDVGELCSSFIVAKDLTLLAELYLVHLEIEKQPKDFYTFQKWGTQLINDFRDIDTYLLDTKKVFIDLENIMELEGWDIDNWSYANSKKLSSKQKENISLSER